jgi:hypothetical protein
VLEAGRGVTRKLDIARRGDAGGDLRRAFRRRRQDQVGRGHRRHFDPQIDAIHQLA